MLNAGWTLFPQFILRSTGFPFGWIEDLAFCDTSSAIDDLLVCEDEISTRRPALQARLSREGSGSIPARRRAWKCVNKWRVFRFDEQDGSALASDLIPALEAWNVLFAKREELGRCARARFERELTAKRRALRDITRDPCFQEAVWLSSPQMYEHGLGRYLRHWNEEARSSELRSAERQIVSFLQRFCAKNDTASFFGPINYGDFEPWRGDPPGPRREHLRTRRGTIAYWAASALAEAIARDGSVLPYLTPRRLPLARFDPVLRTLLVGLSTRRTLDLAEAQVLRFRTENAPSKTPRRSCAAAWTRHSALRAGSRAIAQLRWRLACPSPN